MKKLLAGFQSLSLRVKLILSLIVCIVIPGAIIIGVTGNATKNVITEDTIQNMEQKLELTSQYVSEYLNTMVDTSNRIQFDVEMATLLRKQSKVDPNTVGAEHAEYWLDSRTIHEKISDIGLANDHLYITVLLANGVSYSNYFNHGLNAHTFFEQPWMERLQERSSSQVYWLGAIENYIPYEKEANPYMISIAQTLKRFNEDPYAYVVVSVNERVFRDILTTRATIEDSMLLDDNGVILSHADPDYIGMTFSQEYGSDEQYLVQSRSLPYSNMVLVNVASYHEVVQGINDLFAQQVAWQAAFFSLFLVVMLVLVRRLTRPLVQLGKTVGKVQEGDLAIRSHIQGHDEVGMLGKSFDSMLDQINVIMERLKNEQIMKSEYEFKMLQAQIKPHFLFNILNSVRLRVRMKGDKESAEVLSSLSALLRMTFRYDRELISVQEEIEIVNHYVAILNFRHRNTITLEVDLPKDCEHIQVPRLFLQPIIENAFYHGLQQDSGKIAIRIYRTVFEMVTEVEDNGQGMSDQELQNLREKLDGHEDHVTSGDTHLSGIGLKNVYDRMKLIYGEAFQLELKSLPGVGSTVTMHMPLPGLNEEV